MDLQRDTIFPLQWLMGPHTDYLITTEVGLTSLQATRDGVLTFVPDSVGGD